MVANAKSIKSIGGSLQKTYNWSNLQKSLGIENQQTFLIFATENRNRNRFTKFLPPKPKTETETESQPPKPKPIQKILPPKPKVSHRNRKSKPIDTKKIKKLKISQHKKLETKKNPRVLAVMFCLFPSIRFASSHVHLKQYLFSRIHYEAMYRA